MKVAVVNLNGGVYSPKIDARSDTEKYPSGCRRLDNMIPSIFGGVEKRPGTEFISTDAAFDAIMAAIVAHEGTIVCWENTVVVTDFDALLSQISCHENDSLNYENEMLVESDLMTFVSRALCYENDVLFYENEVLTI